MLTLNGHYTLRIVVAVVMTGLVLANVTSCERDIRVEKIKYWQSCLASGGKMGMETYLSHGQQSAYETCVGAK
jgi:hypothetical protein